MALNHRSGKPSAAIVIGEVLLFHINKGVASKSPTGALLTLFAPCLCAATTKNARQVRYNAHTLLTIKIEYEVHFSCAVWLITSGWPLLIKISL
jgi:hypothetical protein